MSVLVYAESINGEVTRAGKEAVSYARQTADQLGIPVITVSFHLSKEQAKELSQFGVDKIIVCPQEELSQFDSGRYADAFSQIANQESATVFVISNTANGRAFSPRVAIKQSAAIVSGVIDYPKNEDGFVVKKSVYSGKGFANISINTEKKLLAIQPNAIGISEHAPKDAEVVEATVQFSTNRAVTVTGEKKDSEGIPLPEAERVVSGGRGLKGPENWGMVEELAQLLHAATACSRPVSDSGWRPHHEHVGQTGLAIRPNLYIAIGISGAIQHLAGVNQSKVIVVINTDPEAPFFKAADYGIVGDAFEVVPKLIDAWKSQA